MGDHIYQHVRDMQIRAAATAPAATTTIRARFEAFILSQGFSRFSFGLFEAPNCMAGSEGKYIDSRVQAAWLAWQEAERGKAECVEALEALVTVCERPAWSNATLVEINSLVPKARRVLASLKGQK